ncbi:MAG: hypothetical protein QG657_2097 [Acidobacteriota bacterium]|nr:hypothetical protein [Acidobacteriota bacterium]
MKTKSILLTAILSLALFYVPRLPAADYLQRSDLVDKNVDIVIRVSNGADFMKALEDTSYGKLWNSPEMKPFLNNQVLGDTLIKSLLLSRVKESAMAEVLHINRKILSLLKGELIFGIELGKKGKGEGEEKEKSKFYALAEMNEADYKEILDLSRQESKALGEKTVSQRYTFQEVELIQDITSGEEDDLIEWTAFCGNTYLNSSSRQWLEQCIVQLKKEPPAKPSGPPCIQAWLPDGFFERLLNADEEKNKTGSMTGLMKAMGIDNIGKLSLEWVINPSHSELNLRVRNKGGYKGLWTLISKEPIPHGLSLGYVPEDVLSYQVTRVNIHAFWQEIPSLMESFGPQAVAQFQAGLNMAGQMLQVDIGRDIVANLDTVLTSYTRMDGVEDVSLFMWQLRNPMAMEKTLAKLFAENSWLRNMMKENCEILDLNECKIYSFKMPRYRPPVPTEPNAAGQTAEEPPTTPQVDWLTYGVAVVNGDLVFGRLSLLRSYITGSRDDAASRKFYKSPLYTRLIQRVPDNAIGYGFSDITQWLEPTANFLKNAGQRTQTPPPPQPQQPPPAGAGDEKADEAPEPPSKPGPFDDFLNGLKFDRLPAPEFLRAFFGPWISYYQFNGEELVVIWEFHNPTGK